MTGYSGYRMSNNAVIAYEEGEKPLSKWTKSEILNQMKRDGVDKRKIAEISIMDAKTMKDEFLTRSSWHHTSSHYNKTDFYSVDINATESYDPSKYIKPTRAKKVKEEDKGYRVEAEYLEWSGTRNHPKATSIQADGVIKGNWFYPDKEKIKKSTNARGFRIIKIKEFSKRSRRRKHL